nr:MAG TPA: hypothetical protein [Caudoviricetes sp.]DAQ42127.1 MAG TPA: hypothetical protein [Caudoviricetes sp.]
MPRFYRRGDGRRNSPLCHGSKSPGLRAGTRTVSCVYLLVTFIHRQNPSDQSEESDKSDPSD